MPRQIRVPFAIASGGGVDYTSDAVEIDRININSLVGTQPGERVMRPTYGVATMARLFENIDGLLVQELEIEIREVMSTFAPEVAVSRVDVRTNDTPGSADGRIDVAVQYTPALGRLNTGPDLAITTVAAGG